VEEQQPFRYQAEVLEPVLRGNGTQVVVAVLRQERVLQFQLAPQLQQHIMFEQKELVIQQRVYL
jgi:hypothetical protein